MAIRTWFSIQRFDANICDWVARCNDGSDWYSSFDTAIYFCDLYRKDKERVRIVKEEVVYDPDRALQ